MPVIWNGENDRKILLYVLKRVSASDIDFENLATIIPGATPKAVLEHVAKLRREAKSIDGLVEAASSKKDDASPAATPFKVISVKPPPVKTTLAAKGVKRAVTGRSRGRPKKVVDGNGNGEGNGNGDGKAGGGGKRKCAGGILAQDSEDGVDGNAKGSLEDDEEGEIEAKKIKTEQGEEEIEGLDGVAFEA